MDYAPGMSNLAVSQPLLMDQRVMEAINAHAGKWVA